jgi:hypothetical protein
MITLLSILVILSVLGIVATVAAVISDGYRPIRTDWSRVPRRRASPADTTTPDDEPVPAVAPASVEVTPDPAVHVVEPRFRAVRKTPRAAHRLP